MGESEKFSEELGFHEKKDLHKINEGDWDVLQKISMKYKDLKKPNSIVEDYLYDNETDDYEKGYNHFGGGEKSLNYGERLSLNLIGKNLNTDVKMINFDKLLEKNHDLYFLENIVRKWKKEGTGDKVLSDDELDYQIESLKAEHKFFSDNLGRPIQDSDHRHDNFEDEGFD